MEIHSNQKQVTSNSYCQSSPPKDQIAILEAAIRKHESYIQAKEQYDTLNYQFSQLKPKLPPDKPEDPESFEEEDLDDDEVCDEEDDNEETSILEVLTPKIRISKVVCFGIVSIVLGTLLIPYLPLQGISLIIAGILILFFRRIELKLEEQRNNDANIADQIAAHDDYIEELAQWEQTVAEIKEWNNTLQAKRDQLSSELISAKQIITNAKNDLISFVKSHGLTIVDDEHILRAIDVNALRRILHHLKNGDAYTMEDAIYLCSQDPHRHINLFGMYIEVLSIEAHELAVNRKLQEQYEQDVKQTIEQEIGRHDAALHDAQVKQQEELERIRKDLDNIDLLQTLQYIEHTKNNS